MFITSSTGEVTAILTRAGRQLLSDNSASFQISGFSFSDDEIDYSLFDGSSDDAPNTDILSFPILEPSSNENGNCSQRFELLTKQFGTLNISEIHVDNISQNQTFNLVLGDRSRTKEIVIRTLRGYDSVYYLSSTNSNILNVDSDKKLQKLFDDKIEIICKNLGWKAKNVDIKYIDIAVQTYYPLVYVEFFSATRKFDGRRYGKKIEDAAGPEVLRRILGGSEISRAEYEGRYYKKALEVKNLIKNEFEN